MQRRSFIKKAAISTVAAGGAVIASPVFAQNAPKIKWRLASSFPSSADAIFNGSKDLSKFLNEATDGNFQIDVYMPGEVVPALQVLDAVQKGTVECGHSAAYYYYGKDPALSFDAAVPFGLNTRQINAWMRDGNGLKLTREAYDKYNIVNFPCGHTGTQMGGWFRKEINTVEDLKGLKMRASAFAGAVLSRLGVVPQQVAGGDIYPSLEKGTIDAAEWIGPYDDEKLGFNKVAPHYYYPGWWEGGFQVSLYVNKDQYNALPKSYQQLLMQASALASDTMIAKYDTRNPAALRRLIANGAKLQRFSKEILEACFTESEKLYAELSAKDPFFKKIHDDYMGFRNDVYPWFGVAEFNYDAFMLSALRKK